MGAKYSVDLKHKKALLCGGFHAKPDASCGRRRDPRLGELTNAVRKAGLRMGLYYSGGYDWTFVPGPITKPEEYESVQPQTEAYGKYADAHMRELIQRYKPAVLWNDINYPKSGHPLEIMAEYYNIVPDGVIDDRFGVKHSDFKSPEYETLKQISPTKWEECRGLTLVRLQPRRRRSGDDCPERVDLSLRGYRQQERQPSARRWS
jgi:alpha-L-fucosidase